MPKEILPVVPRHFKIIGLDSRGLHNQLLKEGLPKLGHWVTTTADHQEALEPQQGADFLLVDKSDLGHIPGKISSSVISLLNPNEVSVQNIVSALEQGAEHVHMGESARVLSAHMEAIRRRQEMKTPDIINIGDVEINNQNGTVRKGGKLIPLSPTERDVILSLAEAPWRVFPPQELINKVWKKSGNWDYSSLRNVIIHVRHKLDDLGEQSVIRNFRGRGYALGEQNPVDEKTS